MNTEIKRNAHPVLIGAGVAVILFSLVGTAAVLGWLPNSIGGNSPVVMTPDPVISPAQNTARSSPAPVVQPSAPVVVAQAAAWRDCGGVESIREINVAGESNGLGAAGGAVVGGLLGNQVGGGHGRQAMTVVGAIGGAMAGNQVQKNMNSHRSYEITVRMEDGARRSMIQRSAPAWRTGDSVRVYNGAIHPA